MAKMMVYAHQDTSSKLVETKMGDHYVPGDVTVEEAITHTMDYIRRYQFPRRGKHFDSGKVEVKVWDVSEAAIKYNKFYPHSHMDDIVRESIGFNNNTQGVEFHALELCEVINRVNKWISKTNQPLPIAALSTKQYDTADNILEAIKNGKRTIMAELCARFGKTIWSGVIAKESEYQVFVVASYVLTSFSSFIKDLSSFDQFRDFVHVDTKDDNYQELIDEAVANGQPVIAYLSLHNDQSSNRQKRIDYLYNLWVYRMTIIDEADFGAHTTNQALPLINATSGKDKEDDVVILMTGTDSDRAATEWNPDHFVSVTYPELLIDKKLALS